MSINGIIPTTAATGAAVDPAQAPAKVGTSDEFLKLFVAQLKNQSPLDPQDGADFVAQLAQFTTVEQSAETNKHLTDILTGQMSASNASLAGFVGKTGVFSADQFTVSGRGQGFPALGVDLAGAASKVEVVVRDANGNQVKKFDLGPQVAGRVTVPWDGTGDTGGPLAAGDYKIEVTASSADGATTVAHPFVSGLIQAIDFINGVPRLRLGTVSAAPSDVLSIE